MNILLSFSLILAVALAITYFLQSSNDETNDVELANLKLKKVIQTKVQDLEYQLKKQSQTINEIINQNIIKNAVQNHQLQLLKYKIKNSNLKLATDGPCTMNEMQKKKINILSYNMSLNKISSNKIENKILIENSILHNKLNILQESYNKISNNKLENKILIENSILHNKLNILQESYNKISNNKLENKILIENSILHNKLNILQEYYLPLINEHCPEVLLSENKELKREIKRLEDSCVLFINCSMTYAAITKSDGIIPINNQFVNIGNIYFHANNYHFLKGSINSYGYYAVSDGYLYNLHEPGKTPLRLNANHGTMLGYTYISDYEVLCCDYSGYIYKYVFDTKFTTYTSNLFVNSSSVNNFISIIKSMSGYIIVYGRDNNSTGIVNVYDLTGNLLKSMYTITTDYIYLSLLEIQPDVIISGGKEEYSIHNITNISSPTSKNFSTSLNIRSMITLKGGGNKHYIALGGYISENYYGIVQIYQLHEDLSVELFKEIRGLGSYTCYITALYEIEEGRIFIGGDYDCNILCIWEYMSENEPQCTDYIEGATIIDIVQVNNCS